MIKQIKHHRVRHGDVMDKAGISDLMQSDKADIFYSDPPWGEGNLKYWQTMNNKMTGAEKKEVNLDKFLNTIFSLAQTYSKDIVFIEYGVRWRESIIELGEKHGLYHIGIADVQYKSGSRLLPLDLHLFSRHPSFMPKSYFDGLKDTYGLDTLKEAVKPFIKEGGIIFDPCCGMGYSAQIAIDNGMAFRGNELNSKRLMKTIKRLEK